MEKLNWRIGSVKDPKGDRGESEIYQLTCTDCEKSDVGRTRGLLTTRFNKPLREANLEIGKKQTDIGS